MTRILRLVFVAAALCWFANSAAADRYELSLGSSTRYMHSSSVDVLSGDDSAGVFSMAVGFKLDQPRFQSLDVLVDVTYEGGTATGTTFQRMHSETSMHSGLLGARLRWNVSERGSFYGRGALALTRVRLDLIDAFADGPQVGDRGWSGGAYLGGGIEVLPIRTMRDQRERFALGLRLEGGYLATSAVEMRAVPRGQDVMDGAIHIPTEFTSLGDLDISAVSLRFAIVGRF
jgi:hypothetical protein